MGIMELVSTRLNSTETKSIGNISQRAVPIDDLSIQELLLFTDKVTDRQRLVFMNGLMELAKTLLPKFTNESSLLRLLPLASRTLGLANPKEQAKLETELIKLSNSLTLKFPKYAEEIANLVAEDDSADFLDKITEVIEFFIPKN